MIQPSRFHSILPWALMALLTLVAAVVYAPGLHGGFLFDDYPNIVDNPSIRIDDLSFSNLVRSAMSSPSSQLKRPLASLSFSANYIAAGMTPYAMKLTNLFIHLINGWLTFLLVRQMFLAAGSSQLRAAWAAAVCAGAWLLLPINLTAVLYIVQRMESLAHTFVLIGLLGYAITRRVMVSRSLLRDRILMIASLVVPLSAGLLTKETAVMLPLYAFVLECTLFRFRSLHTSEEQPRRDRMITGTYVVILLVPMIAGLAWLIPGLMTPQAWSTRDFTISTRLLSEARIVCDYVAWTVVPRSEDLSFYHDDFAISTGFFSPWSTILSVCALSALLVFAVAIRRRSPLVCAGIMLFFAAHLLTATILPLELVYEHRNYFASLGLVIALISGLFGITGAGVQSLAGKIVVLSAFFSWWVVVTASSAYAWGDSLRLAEELADRDPGSPRAQYELGRAYIIASHYSKDSPYTPLVYAPLARAAAIRDATILPEQALIFFNARMLRPIDSAWWSSIEMKLRANKVTVQDESALIALLQCDISKACDLSADRLGAAYLAALSHPSPSARLLSSYGEFLWHIEANRADALRAFTRAVGAAPREPAYRIGLIRLLAADGQLERARDERSSLLSMNIGGSLDHDIENIDTLLGR